MYLPQGVFVLVVILLIMQTAKNRRPQCNSVYAHIAAWKVKMLYEVFSFQVFMYTFFLNFWSLHVFLAWIVIKSLRKNCWNIWNVEWSSRCVRIELKWSQMLDISWVLVLGTISTILLLSFWTCGWPGVYLSTLETALWAWSNLVQCTQVACYCIWLGIKRQKLYILTSRNLDIV